MIVDQSIPGLAAVFVGLTVFFALYAIFAPVKSSPLGSEEPFTALGDLSGSPTEGIGKYVKPILSNFLPQFPLTTLAPGRKRKIEELLIKSGNPWKLNAEEFFASQIAFAVIGAVAGFAVSFIPALSVVPPLALIVLFTAMGALIPYSTYNTRRQARAREAQKGLPDALDLLTVTLNSGKTFEPALRTVTHQMPEGVLREEFTRVDVELSAGVTLEHSLRTLYRNIDSEEVEAFAKAIIQTQQLGSDVSETLARQADFARSNYRALLDRMIARLNTTLFIPLSLTMLPALLIVFIAPTLSQLTSQLG